jgi:hypothetical protein
MARNRQLFALPKGVPPALTVAGGRCELVRVFKHDFFAATCLYRPCGGGERIVVKFMRRQGFCGLPLEWCSRLLLRREEAVYAALGGIGGVPRWLGRVDDCTFAVQYIDGRPLDHAPPPPGFFGLLAHLVSAIHFRGVAISDLNKRSNILVSHDGRPFVVDFQLSLRRRDELPWPLRSLVAALVRYIQRRDLYHIYKHKRRLRPGELTADEDALSRDRDVLLAIHRCLTDPWRALRRRFLRSQHRKGQLISPTHLHEDHWQPEKATWRQ